jgi:hypothetical protein
MALDLDAWRRVLEDIVDSIADEELQRRSWFGLGPEIWSPDEAFNQFFGDAAVEEFLDRGDTGLTRRQVNSGRKLVALMQELSAATPEHIDPADLVDDPRWRRIRAAATRFRSLLQTGNVAA